MRALPRLLVGAAAIGVLTGCATRHVAAPPPRTVTAIATRTVTVTPKPPRSPASATPAPQAAPAPASPSAAPAFGCKVLSGNGAGGDLEFGVTTVGGGTYSGTINVSFYDYPGSGDIFPSATVDGAGPVPDWQPVPAADVGASAAPEGCIASVG
jgi:hypothetical protein